MTDSFKSGFRYSMYIGVKINEVEAGFTIVDHENKELTVPEGGAVFAQDQIWATKKCIKDIDLYIEEHNKRHKNGN